MPRLDLGSRGALLRLAALGTIAALTGACAHSGTRPDAMSEADHVKAAALHRQQADKSKSLGAQQDKVRAFPMPTSESYRWTSDRYDPYGNASAAEKHTRAAKAHLAAAQTLRNFEEASCGDFPSEIRSRCPLLGTVERIASTKKGVRLFLVKDANFEAVVAHVRCHRAFARSRAYQGMSACPLYLPDVTLDTKEGSILLEGKSEETTRALRARIASHLAPPDEKGGADDSP